MAIVDGNPVNAAYTNSVLASKTVDNTLQGVQDLNNTTDPNSGAQVPNAQQRMNELSDMTGQVDGSGTNTDYASNNVIVDGQTLKAAIEALDGRSIGTLSDVDLTGLADTQILAFNNVSGNFEPINQPGGGGATDLDSLTDVTIVAVADNNLLQYNTVSSQWENVAGPAGAIVGDSDAQTLTNKTIDGDNNTITNLAHGAEVDNPTSGVHGVTGDVVGTSDTQTLTNKTIAASSNTLDIAVEDLSNVDFPVAPTANQVLAFNNVSGNFEPANQSGGGATQLNDLSDVDLTVPATDGQILIYNNATSNFEAGNQAALGSIDNLSDVDTTTTAPNVGEVLEWDGANWVPGAGSTPPSVVTNFLALPVQVSTHASDVYGHDAVRHPTGRSASVSVSSSGIVQVEISEDDWASSVSNTYTQTDRGFTNPTVYYGTPVSVCFTNINKIHFFNNQFRGGPGRILVVRKSFDVAAGVMSNETEQEIINLSGAEHYFNDALRYDDNIAVVLAVAQTSGAIYASFVQDGVNWAAGAAVPGISTNASATLFQNSPIAYGFTDLGPGTRFSIIHNDGSDIRHTFTDNFGGAWTSNVISTGTANRPLVGFDFDDNFMMFTYYSEATGTITLSTCQDLTAATPAFTEQVIFNTGEEVDTRQGRNVDDFTFNQHAKNKMRKCLVRGVAMECLIDRRQGPTTSGSFQTYRYIWADRTDLATFTTEIVSDDNASINNTESQYVKNNDDTGYAIIRTTYGTDSEAEGRLFSRIMLTDFTLQPDSDIGDKASETLGGFLGNPRVRGSMLVFEKEVVGIEQSFMQALVV